MKNQIRQLIAEGNLDEALPKLHAAAEAVADTAAADETTLLQNRHAENQRKARQDTHDPAAIAREHNSIAADALALLKQLPDAPPQPAAAPKGIREQAMKQHILLLTFGVKAWVVVWLFNHWEAGGFSDDQFTGALTLLLPVMAAYTGLMFQDFLDHRHAQAGPAPASPRVRRSVQWTVYAVIIGYGLMLTAVIGAKPKGMSYAQFSSALAFIESALGIYIARIVRTFFPEQKSNPS